MGGVRGGKHGGARRSKEKQGKDPSGLRPSWRGEVFAGGCYTPPTPSREGKRILPLTYPSQTGFPIHSVSGDPNIRQSEHPEIRASGDPNIRKSEHPNIRTSDDLSIQGIGKSKAKKTTSQNQGTGKPTIRLSELRRLYRPGVTFPLSRGGRGCVKSHWREHPYSHFQKSKISISEGKPNAAQSNKAFPKGNQTPPKAKSASPKEKQTAGFGASLLRLAPHRPS